MFQFFSFLKLFSDSCFSTYSLSSQLEPSLSNALPTKVNSIRGSNRRLKKRPPQVPAAPPDSKPIESLEASASETESESSSDPDSGDERDFAAFLASARPAPPPRIKLEPGTSQAATASAAATADATGASSMAQEKGSQGSAAVAAPNVSQTDADAASDAALRRVRVQHYVPVLRPPQIQAQRLLLPILSEEQVCACVVPCRRVQCSLFSLILHLISRSFPK